MTEEKRPGSPGPDLVELARPFVIMVCEELANAFVKVLGAGAAANTLKAAAGQDNGRRQPFAGEVGGGRPAAWPKALEREALDLDDDQHHGETDVQPLFDPKLPPAANSPFRPRSRWWLRRRTT